MFLHLSVILSGRCLLHCMLGYTHPGQTPRTPRDTTGYSQQAGDTHLTGMYICSFSFRSFCHFVFIYLFTYGHKKNPSLGSGDI